MLCCLNFIESAHISIMRRCGVVCWGRENLVVHFIHMGYMWHTHLIFLHHFSISNSWWVCNGNEKIINPDWSICVRNYRATDQLEAHEWQQVEAVWWFHVGKKFGVSMACSCHMLSSGICRLPRHDFWAKVETWERSLSNDCIWCVWFFCGKLDFDLLSWQSATTTTT